MGIYGIAMCDSVIAAEAARPSGAPADAMIVQSRAFAGLLLASIALAISGYVRR
jgi:hypothetical protein